MITLGQKLKKLREDRQKTQLEISKIINVNYQTIYKYEKDIVVPPTESLAKLANYFNVSLDYLLGMDEPIQIAASMKDGLDLSDMSEQDKAVIIAVYNSLNKKKEN